MGKGQGPITYPGAGGCRKTDTPVYIFPVDTRRHLWYNLAVGEPRRLKYRDIESLDFKKAIQHNWPRIYSKCIVNDRGCWEYQQEREVPELMHDGKRVPVYRISFILCKGEIPAGLYVCHQCDNPKCCNPMHLWLGTPQQNSMDRAEKGRVPEQYETSWKKTLKRKSSASNTET